MRKKIEQKNLQLVQSQVRGVRTRRQTRRPDYVYNDGVSEVRAIILTLFTFLNYRRTTIVTNTDLKRTKRWMLTMALTTMKTVGIQQPEPTEAADFGMVTPEETMKADAGLCVKLTGKGNLRTLMNKRNGEENDVRDGLEIPRTTLWTKDRLGNDHEPRRARKVAVHHQFKTQAEKANHRTPLKKQSCERLEPPH